jgi:NAD dependent epimerase/dehydratase
MRYKKKRVLVTGSEGFIGSHLAERLFLEGASVTCLVQYNSQGNIGWLEELPPKALRKLRIVFGDIRDGTFVSELLANQDVVFHLAALISIPYSYVSPMSYFETNVRGTINLAQAAIDNSVESLVVTSTSEVYGTALYTPIDESHPLQGQSPYSASKIAADKIAESYNLSFGAPISVIRPFNTFGPRQSTRAIIPSVVTQLLSQNKQAQLGDPSPLRDFLHVSDTVEGFLLAGLSKSIFGEVINLCSGEEHSMLEVASSCAEQLGLDPITSLVWGTDIRLRPEKSEVRQLIGSNAKALKLLGWKPKTNFSQGLAHAVEWFKNPDNLKKYRSDLHL